MSNFLNLRVAPLVLVGHRLPGGGDAVDPHGKTSAMAPSMDEAAAATVPSKGVVLAQATFSDPNDQNFDVKRITDDWHVQIKSKPAFDMAVQDIMFPIGAASGWHTHPGPVFILVKSGTLTFYQSDDPTCSAQQRSAGQGFLDLGEHPHIAVNQSGAPAETIVTYFAPPGTPPTALKIMATEPPNCTI